MNKSDSLKRFTRSIRTLQGEPHYIALGLAVGVFVACTPTVPFQTAMAVALALLFKASKPAAVIGSLTANPVTIPFFYIGSYKIGQFLLGGAMPEDVPYTSFLALLKLGAGAAIAVLSGGALLGLVAGMMAYPIGLGICHGVRARLKTSHPQRHRGLGEPNSKQPTLPENRASS
jgi:uncharacterized protein (DUF2062 family)